jgi:pyruvate/2-oxoglutarate dehydrogenase complex dihydrolipoamide dehydrogenase (E3) component
MTQAMQCDVAILGAGAGGLSLAAGAVQMGARVVLVESGKMGGDCLNYGCVPSKTLLEAAHSKLSFLDAMARVHDVIEKLSHHDSVLRFEGLGVHVIQAPGKFIDKKTLAAGDRLIQAKRFVIATGSAPFVPPIPGLDGVRYETNETIFNLEKLPEHLIVIGGGPIGCELAQAFSLLGARVTILEVFKLLPKDDAGAVQVVREALVAQGIEIHERIQIKSVSVSKEGHPTVHYEQEGQAVELLGTHLLVSTGRRANVQELGLDKAGVKFSEKGIEVDKRLRSSNKKIYGLGDVVGSFQFTHVASYHAGIVLKNILFRLPAQVDYRAVPWVTYTNPAIAHVGMLCEEAKSLPHTRVTQAFFSGNDRAVARGNTLGQITAITDKKGRILGVTIVGLGADELILPWVIAIREKKSLRAFTDTIVPYPTLSEISKRVAGEFYKPTLFSSNIRRLVRILLSFG